MTGQIGVALSGGGHRASLFGLGALLYLTDAGKNKDVTSIASVSGGSLTNGFIAQNLSFSQTSPEQLRSVATGLTTRVARTGTLWAGAETKLYVALLAVVGIACLAIPFVPSPIWLRVLLFLGLLWAFASLAGARGQVCGRAFARTLFGATLLRDIDTNIDHVFCATDLHAGEHVYFSGRFVCAYRFGWGEPSDLPLHSVVQASASLPGAFPPRWLPTSSHDFVDPQDPDAANAEVMVLVDGGVYDNMGDQWGSGVRRRNERWKSHFPALHEPDELIVVNSSAGLGWTSQSKLRMPLLGELLALLRDKDVLYDNGTSVRRRELVAAFDLAARENRSPRGVLVHIAQSPFTVVDAFKESQQWPDRAQRARGVLEVLGDSREEWKAVARRTSSVKTTLSALKDRPSVELLRHAYVLAMVNCHVILGYPLLSVPDDDYFKSLLN